MFPNIVRHTLFVKIGTKLVYGTPFTAVLPYTQISIISKGGGAFYPDLALFTTFDISPETVLYPRGFVAIRRNEVFSRFFWISFLRDV